MGEWIKYRILWCLWESAIFAYSVRRTHPLSDSNLKYSIDWLANKFYDKFHSFHHPRSPAPLFIDIAGLGYYTHVKRSRHHTSLNSSSPCPLTLIIIRWIVVIHIVMGLQLFVQQSKRTLPTTVLVHYNIIIQSYILLSYRTRPDQARPY